MKCTPKVRQNLRRCISFDGWMFIRTSNAQEDKELIEIFNNVGNEKSKIALAVAQHYDRKTRCLDFTRNYKIALYFACNPNDSAYNEDGAIFILEGSYHRPEWYTNYLVYHTAIDSRNDISSWEYSNYIIQKNEKNLKEQEEALK